MAINDVYDDFRNKLHHGTTIYFVEFFYTDISDITGINILKD